jgi:hypothetical protein
MKRHCSDEGPKDNAFKARHNIRAQKSPLFERGLSSSVDLNF